MNREKLRIAQETCGVARACGAVHSRLATDEDLAALGYVKRPVCGTCERTPGRVRMVNGEVVSDALGWCDAESSVCPSCGGTGFGRLVALDGIILDAIRRHYEREAQMWPEGVERAPKSETMVRVVDIHEALVAIDRGDTDGVA